MVLIFCNPNKIVSTFSSSSPARLIMCWNSNNAGVLLSLVLFMLFECPSNSKFSRNECCCRALFIHRALTNWPYDICHKWETTISVGYSFYNFDGYKLLSYGLERVVVQWMKLVYKIENMNRPCHLLFNQNRNIITLIHVIERKWKSHLAGDNNKKWETNNGESDGPLL